MTSALVLVAGLAAVFIVTRKIRQYYALREFDGPWSAGFSRLWLLWASRSGKMHLHYTAVNNQYGPTARIAPHMLITKDPELVKEMSAVRSAYTRSDFYTALRLHPTRDNITSITDEALHSDLRSRMAHGYSGKENTSIESDVDAQLLALFSLITTKYLSSKSHFAPVDLSHIITFFTLDVISTVAFGHRFGFIAADNDPFGYIANLQQFLPAILIFAAYTELQKILRMPILKAVLPKSTDKRGLGAVMGFARERIRERFGDKPIVRQDMVGSFIKRALSQEELESETLTQITAGSDSTTSALRMTLYFISTNPAVQTRLLAEAEAAIVSGRISRPLVKDAEARKLPYLQACIKEGLRMYPPVTGLLAEQTPKDGACIDGKFAPPGTWIAWNSWAMMRDRDIFGKDAEIFRPERWLPRDDGAEERARVDRMTETVGLVFGYGRFGCLGRGVATMELNKGIVEMLLRFNMQPVDRSHPFVERCVGFFLHEDMFFRISKREEDEFLAKSIADSGSGHYGVSALPRAPDY